MKMNMFAVAAAIAASTVATGASAQTVTPESVLKLPVGASFVNAQHPRTSIVRTAQGFNFVEGATTVVCNNVTKAGGRGNATVNCTAPNKNEIRFEWIDANSMKVEAWENMAAKAGQTQNKPPRISAIFKRK